MLNNTYAFDGQDYERTVTIKINKRLINRPDFLNAEDVVAVHVNSNKRDNLNNRSCKPKADIYFTKIKNIEYLRTINCYINEEVIKHIPNIPIEFSGVSVKKEGSTKITLLKVSPSAFKNIFKDIFLGAAASVYVNEKEIYKNDNIIKAWGVSHNSFIERSSNLLNCDFEYHNINHLRLIKSEANNLINNMVDKSEQLQKLIFQGTNIFDEPYTAPLKYDGGPAIKQNIPYPISVTTGSGRSKGIYTLAFKPK